jgi:DNA-binding transcriptional LysR family regulator
MSDPDFNLLRVFEILMEERQVTGAAKRLNLTQSAVSHALRRLRKLFDDPLFLRGTGGLTPTARAEEMAPDIRDGLNQLRRALSPAPFDPASSARRFTIAAGSYFCDLFVPTIVEHVRRDAPSASLRFVPVTEQLVSLLDQGSVDLVLGGLPDASARLIEEPLFEEEIVWVSAASNPVAPHAIDMAALEAMPRVTISIPRPWNLPSSGADHELAVCPRMMIEAGMSARDGALNVYDSQTALGIVARTSTVALVPRRLATLAAAAGCVAILTPAIAFTTVSMLSHRKQQHDGGLAWLREIVRRSVV